MAGSGKTTLIQRINSHLHTRGQPGYIINLDPAVAQLPYSANIDIRDTVGGPLRRRSKRQQQQQQQQQHGRAGSLAQGALAAWRP
jgi:GTPase SAR1 family protein